MKTTPPKISASDAAAALGYWGGKSKSKAKQAAVRENGKKGGRPKKTFDKRKPKR
jgi:purine nucleoside permease